MSALQKAKENLAKRNALVARLLRREKPRGKLVIDPQVLIELELLNFQLGAEATRDEFGLDG